MKGKAERPEINWQKISERLHGALKDARSDTIEQSAAILAARAAKLAVAPEATNDQEILELLVFSLANEFYAIENKYIREVCKLTNLTTVPQTPAHLTGLTNLKGEIVSVYDLTPFLSAEKMGLAQLNCLIVLGVDKYEFAVLANSLEKQRVVTLSEILPLDDAFNLNSDSIVGVTRDGMIVLNGQALISEPRLHIT